MPNHSQPVSAEPRAFAAGGSIPPEWANFGAYLSSSHPFGLAPLSFGLQPRISDAAAPAEKFAETAAGERTLSGEERQEIAVDFLRFVEDTRPTKHFNDMNDEELLECLSEYLGSYTVNTNINGPLVENACSILEELLMSEEELAELPDPKTPEGKAARVRAALQKADDIRQEQERSLEIRRLSEEEREILSQQSITSDGKRVSVLDIVDNLDRLLNNWDNTYADMEAGGLTNGKDKESLRQIMTRYRNMMADTKLTEEEKQRRREEMIRNGELTRTQAEYLDNVNAEQKQQIAALQTSRRIKDSATSDISVRKADILEEPSRQKTPLNTAFSSATRTEETEPAKEAGKEIQEKTVSHPRQDTLKPISNSWG